MSKVIKMNDDIKEILRKKFEEALEESDMLTDGKFSYNVTLQASTEKASVIFTESAWLKMQALIREFDKEVAWHGVATRADADGENRYLISDILVYPQNVTGATVNTDQEEYQTWLMSHDDDVFNNIRMQGHSHVNMGVTPSSVDETLYEKFINQLEDDMFYIFMIWNKKGDKTIKIYDMAKNTMFDTSDCEVRILDNQIGIEGFIKNAKESVKDRVFTSTKTTSKTTTTKSYSAKDYHQSSLDDWYEDYEYPTWEGYGYYNNKKYGRGR